MCLSLVLFLCFVCSVLTSSHQTRDQVCLFLYLFVCFMWCWFGECSQLGDCLVIVFQSFVTEWLFMPNAMVCLLIACCCYFCKNTDVSVVPLDLFFICPMNPNEWDIQGKPVNLAKKMDIPRASINFRVFAQVDFQNPQSSSKNLFTSSNFSLNFMSFENRRGSTTLKQATQCQELAWSTIVRGIQWVSLGQTAKKTLPLLKRLYSHSVCCHLSMFFLAGGSGWLDLAMEPPSLPAHVQGACLRKDFSR